VNARTANIKSFVIVLSPQYNGSLFDQVFCLRTAGTETLGTERPRVANAKLLWGENIKQYRPLAAFRLVP
jgi:hypothetical protein